MLNLLFRFLRGTGTAQNLIDVIGVLDDIRVVGLLLLACTVPIVLVAFLLDLILLLRHPDFKLEGLLLESARRYLILAQLELELLCLLFFPNFDVLLADSNQLWLTHQVILRLYLAIGGDLLERVVIENRVRSR